MAIELVEKEIFSRSPLTLYEPIEYAMHQGGKRIRPLLCLIGCELCGKDANEATSAALAVEMLHNFTLLHDDIMDRSPLRRGQPTVYQKYDTNKAILSGDALFALSFERLLECGKENAAELVAILSRGAVEVCEGQAFDMDFEQRTDVSLSEYIEMIRLKTGVLLSTALKLGAVCAGARGEILQRLDTFGHNIGIAFQIQDDLFDCWSDLAVFGKVCGTDIADKKKTYPYLIALQTADENLRCELLSLYNSDSIDKEEKTAKVKAIYENLDVQTLARKAILLYNQTALDALERMSVPTENKNVLMGFANKLINRTK